MVRKAFTVFGVTVAVTLLGISGYFLPHHPPEPESLIEPSIVERIEPRVHPHPGREIPLPLTIVEAT